MREVACGCALRLAWDSSWCGLTGLGGTWRGVVGPGMELRRNSRTVLCWDRM